MASGNFGCSYGAELDWLLRKLAYTEQTFLTHFVEADPATRFQRLKALGGLKSQTTWREFRKRDEREQRMGLDNIRRSSKAEIVHNQHSFEEYIALVDGWAATCGEKDVDTGRVKGTRGRD